jgi:activator of HSP90 ATPase
MTPTPKNKDSLRVSATFNVSPARVYRAWLNSKEHAAFTGSKAVASAKRLATFSAWDGYIRGKNIELNPPRRIVQSWRASDFPPDAEDSRLEITFVEVKGKTLVTIRHTGIPTGMGRSYKQGWKEFYFTPMKQYFEGDE